jgi:hypothetical protein
VRVSSIIWLAAMNGSRPSGPAISVLDGLTAAVAAPVTAVGCGPCGGVNGVPTCSQMAWAMASPAWVA